MTDAEALKWVEEHVTSIRMNITGDNDPGRLTVEYIDDNGEHDVVYGVSLKAIAKAITEAQALVKGQ